MTRRNEHFAKLQAGYLFPEVTRRKNKLLETNPEAKIISLGIGNTTEPLTPHISNAMIEAINRMQTRAGYQGYGDEQGFAELREKLAQKYYAGLVKAEEVFISDGAKCDLARLQMLFGPKTRIAMQDPAYPVYVDSSVIEGATGPYNKDSAGFEGLTYWACSPDNNFFPNLKEQEPVDVIFFCSPNNPTGAVATRQQLEELVAYAKATRAIIVFDAAYAMYIQDPGLPKTIYEIPGADEVAIEINSFSKSAGFTGLRLGWSVVPNKLQFEDGSPVRPDWVRIMTTLFNGASNIIQWGGLAALEEKGWEEMQGLIKYYLENARLIKACLEELNIENYGGFNAPYIWANFLRTTFLGCF
jgi:LL-diaminopimelate aminotransferase